MIDRGQPGWHGFDGPAIELDRITSENSGRYEIAEIMARVFPQYRAFATGVMKDLDTPIPSGQYPKDILAYKSRTVVAYTTPPQAEGLGTHRWVKQNDYPITGVAMLIGNPPDLFQLSVRLPPDLDRLKPLIVHQFELEAARKQVP